MPYCKNDLVLWKEQSKEIAKNKQLSLTFKPELPNMQDRIGTIINNNNK